MPPSTSGHCVLACSRLRTECSASWTEAEDIVQDAWLRWQGCDRSTVLNPSAFLVTTTTRLALNAARSARARDETSVGHWDTEPVDASGDPERLAGRDEALELGIQLVLKKLSPTEHAAYVLHEAFDYPYERIAQLLYLTEVNARQVVSRAGRHLATGRRGGPVQGTAAARGFCSRSSPPPGAVSSTSSSTCSEPRRRGVGV